MPQATLIAPILAMAGLTLAVLILTAGVRVLAIKRGQARMSYFKTLTGEAPNALIAKTTRNLANLFETPVLFYVVCLALQQQGLADGTAATLAWTYVALRLIHAVIHITYNDVNHRFTAFALSLIVLGGLWIKLGAAIAG